MNHKNERIECTPSTTRDLFLELWATEMLVRHRLAEMARALVAVAKRLIQSGSGAANVRATLMLAAVFAIAGTMIRLLEAVMPAWRAALSTSAILATVGLALLQERWVAGAAGVVRQIRRDVPQRALARVRTGSR